MSEVLRHEMRKVGLQESLQTLGELFAEPMLVSRRYPDQEGESPWNWPVGITEAKVLKIYAAGNTQRRHSSVFLCVSAEGVFFDIIAEQCVLCK